MRIEPLYKHRTSYQVSTCELTDLHVYYTMAFNGINNPMLYFYSFSTLFAGAGAENAPLAPAKTISRS